jgi:hypothetical protein
LIRLRATIRPSTRHVNSTYRRVLPINGRVILSWNPSHDLARIIRLLQAMRPLAVVVQTVYLCA